MIYIAAAIGFLVVIITVTLLARLRKGNVEVNLWYDEEVWQERLLAESKRAANGRQLLVMCVHFDNTRTWLTESWQEAGYSWQECETADALLEALETSTGGGLLLVDTTDLAVSSGLDPVASTKLPVRLLEAELFPTPSRHQKLEKILMALPKKAELLVFSHMGAEIFTRAVGPEMLQLFDKFGMERDEPIAHDMIYSAINNLQKKYAKKVGDEVQATRFANVATWFDLHQS